MAHPRHVSVTDECWTAVKKKKLGIYYQFCDTFFCNKIMQRTVLKIPWKHRINHVQGTGKVFRLLTCNWSDNLWRCLYVSNRAVVHDALLGRPLPGRLLHNATYAITWGSERSLSVSEPPLILWLCLILTLISFHIEFFSVRCEGFSAVEIYSLVTFYFHLRIVWK